MLFVGTLLNSCSTVQTVRPKIVQAKQPSADSSTPAQYKTQQNSGYLYTVKDSTGKATGGLITDHALQRYNALATKWGHHSEFVVPINPNDGVKPAKDQYGNDVYFIDLEHLVAFQLMNRMERQPELYKSAE